MARPTKRPERKRTDESLADERAKADQALVSKLATIEAAADGVIERARDDADEVLAAARAKADEKLRHPTSPEQSHAVTDEERSREDQTVEAARTEADAALRRERAASARVLARLLPLEREKTDQFLLTERARSDDAVAHRDDFLAMVSHDLRNLLNGIVMSAAVISENTRGAEETKPSQVAAHVIQRSAGRMARLISDLVDIASIDAGKLAVVPIVMDVSAAVVEAVETWTPPAVAKGIVLEYVPHASVSAKADPERLLQILGNLITNALKFSPRGAKVVVSVEQIGGEARFSVKDSGVGMPADMLDAIFERFWQVGGNDRRGLGLGLYISKCLVTAHGGKIWAESEPGVGSTFTFTLPA